MNEFLLEVLTEEIPARFQKSAIDDFEQLIIAGLSKVGVAFSDVQSYISPRRIVFFAKLSPIVAEFIEERRGPQATAPNEVIEKFLAANGVSRNQCKEKTIDKKTFIVASIVHEAQQTEHLLEKIVKDAICGIKWLKSMHWGNHSFNFARPIRNIMCIFGGKLVDIDFSEEINLRSVTYTFGHRFMAPEKVFPNGIDDYLQKMKKAFVIVDRNERRKIILDECSKLSKDGLTVDVSDEDLLEEIVGLTEYPVVLRGKIPDKFMSLPDEVIITPMKDHQRYFPMRNGTKLAPYFVFVANNVAEDGGKKIIAGNERVLNARLSDALFFYDTDVKIPLENHLDDLKKIMFNDKLGTVYERVERIKSLCSYLYDEICPPSQKSDLISGAILAKCDLSTHMVCEFTELQGIMGAYYAAAQGKNPEICRIIREQYKQPEELTSLLSALFSLADKFELISGMFAIGKEPTGSKDPFALRRAAIGIIKIIIKYNISLNAYKVIDFVSKELLKKDGARAKVMSFIMDRLKVFLKDKGVTHDIVAMMTSSEHDILSAYKRAIVLDDMLKKESGQQLLLMYKRAKNIIQDKEIGEVDESLFSEKEEQDLLRAVNSLKRKIANIENSSADESEKWEAELTAALEIKPILTTFFEKVFVEDSDPKIACNRNSILSNFCEQLSRIFQGI